MAYPTARLHLISRRFAAISFFISAVTYLGYHASGYNILEDILRVNLALSCIITALFMLLLALRYADKIDRKDTVVSVLILLSNVPVTFTFLLLIVVALVNLSGHTFLGD